MKLLPDLDAGMQKRIFEVLREDSPVNLFEGFSAADVE
jgi:hypothetical protein